MTLSLNRKDTVGVVTGLKGNLHYQAIISFSTSCKIKLLIDSFSSSVQTSSSLLPDRSDSKLRGKVKTSLSLYLRMWTITKKRKPNPGLKKKENHGRQCTHPSFCRHRVTNLPVIPRNLWDNLTAFELRSGVVLYVAETSGLWTF